MSLEMAHLLTDISEIIAKILQSTGMLQGNILQGNILQGNIVQFALQGGAEQCGNCPGAESSLVAAAWANIGYMTHAALLHYVNFTGFGAWAILLYVVAAGGALISVALNSPPRNYVWFFLGPAIYSFLIGTTQEVKGVDWAVAGESQNMKEVWRDAETGLRNSPLLKISDYSGMTINKNTGPSQDYKVATPMLFLDELFSATTNMLVGWTGVNSQLGEGGNNSNLARNASSSGNAGTGSGSNNGTPWFLLSTLKAPMVENITNARIRNSSLRDSFITFLSSECGDAFKQAINSGSYNAATMSRGSVIPKTIMIGGDATNNNFGENDTLGAGGGYQVARKALRKAEMPTPRALYQILSEAKNNEQPGSLGKFSTELKEGTLLTQMGQNINCSNYLRVLIKGILHETGHAYWQLIRTAPRGFTTEEDVLFTLFYGWDIREKTSADYANELQIKNFTKYLIFTYILKNELEFAPSITATEQKFAPADQTQQYAQTYVANVGSKSKSSELYNWALMLPHVQGILLYVIIVAYPLAAMAIVIPGYWKAFFTWVTFFAWIKMWDVGFAVVQVLERSVWAMMGNHSNMARVANMLIQVGNQGGEVEVSCGSGANGSDVMGSNNSVMNQCAVPDVEEGDPDDNGDNGFFYLDKALLLGASVDLNVANGYYLYIMAALYLAVPAVTGQLILGAKAGLGGLATNALGENAKDISAAAKSGFQGDMANQIMATKEQISQAALAKAFGQGRAANGNDPGRPPGVAHSAFLGSIGATNDALREGRNAARFGSMAHGLDARGRAFGLNAASWDSTGRVVSAVAGAGAATTAALFPGAGGGVNGNGNAGGRAARFANAAGQATNAAIAWGSNDRHQPAFLNQAQSLATGADLHWDGAAATQRGHGHSANARNLGDQAQFQADTAAWEARNSFAQNSSGLAGVYGVNAGSLSPGSKPTDRMGMAMEGMLGNDIGSQARYAGSGFLGSVNDMQNAGIGGFGSGQVLGAWGQESVRDANGRETITNPGGTPTMTGMAGQIFSGGPAADGVNAVNNVIAPRMDRQMDALGQPQLPQGNNALGNNAPGPLHPGPPLPLIR